MRPGGWLYHSTHTLTHICSSTLAPLFSLLGLMILQLILHFVARFGHLTLVWLCLFQLLKRFRDKSVGNFGSCGRPHSTWILVAGEHLPTSHGKSQDCYTRQFSVQGQKTPTTVRPRHLFCAAGWHSTIGGTFLFTFPELLSKIQALCRVH